MANLVKLNRKKNSVRNVIYGTIFRIVSIVGPFVVRTAMIYIMGNEYNGLSSLFTSILQFLSLVELGAGSALVFSMYKPIAENDTATINALYALYKKLYRIIGSIIFGIGLLLVPALPFLVKKDLPPDVNLYVIYFVYLLNTVLSYWLFGYKQSLLNAFQRSDIVSKRTTAINILMYVVQILSLFLFHNYYCYIIWLPICTVLTNVVNKIVVDKMFPQYKCEGTVSKELSDSIKKKIVALFGTKANSIVLHATDNVVISAFFGVGLVGQYGNYYYIMNSVCMFVKIIYSSITAGIGNSLQTESVEKNYRDFMFLSFVNMWIITFCSTSLLCIYQPFMEIWVKEKLMLEMGIVSLIVVYFFVYMIRRVVLTYKDAAGIWWEDKFRPYVVMAVNLILNIGLCSVIGLYGILLSTIVSMFVAIPWENYTVFKYIFKISSKEYYLKMALYVVVAILIAGATYTICNYVPFINIPKGIIGVVIRGIICVIVPNAIWALIFIKTREFGRLKKLVFNRKKKTADK